MYKSNRNASNKKQNNIEDIIEQNMPKLMDKNGLVRQKARKKLVDIGVPAVDYLAEFETHPKGIARWEAVKALSQIHDPITAPLLLNALEDSNEDVRWLAAEGLAALNEEGLNALLAALISRKRTIYLLEGAHHILTRLRSKIEKPIINELLQILDHPDAELKLPLKIMTYMESNPKNNIDL